MYTQVQISRPQGFDRADVDAGATSSKMAQISCISTARSLRASVRYLGNEEGGSEAYNIHNRTDKVAFLDIGQSCIEGNAEHCIPPASGLMPSSASLKIEKPSSVFRPNAL